MFFTSWCDWGDVGLEPLSYGACNKTASPAPSLSQWHWTETVQFARIPPSWADATGFCETLTDNRYAGIQRKTPSLGRRWNPLGVLLVGRGLPNTVLEAHPLLPLRRVSFSVAPKVAPSVIALPSIRWCISSSTELRFATCDCHNGRRRAACGWPSEWPHGEGILQLAHAMPSQVSILSRPTNKACLVPLATLSDVGSVYSATLINAPIGWLNMLG